MAQRTAENVAEMETELHYLRNEIEATRRDLTLANAEVSRLKIENAVLEGRSRDYLAKAVRIETIMSQVSYGLVAGLNEMRQEREVARAVRRQSQEEQLGVGDEDKPFLDQGARAGRVEERRRLPGDLFKAGQRGYEAEQARAEQLRGVAERIAPSPMPKRTIDNTLAARDPRLPQIDFQALDEDQGSLRSLAGYVTGESRG